MNLDDEILSIRKDFPILNRRVRNNKKLVYLDNAATTQKPKIVIDTITKYYSEINANVHRGIHALSEEASEQYEKAHQTVSNFVNAKFEEMIFTKNTTESINVVANGMERLLEKGDEIVLTRFEHHANLIPFQQVARKVGAKIKFIESVDFDNIDIQSAENVIGEKTKLISIPHMSNVLGSIIPVDDIVRLARENDALIHLDAAQSVPHMEVDVKKLDVDLLSFSGHKMLAPMGTGGLYGKQQLLEDMHPFLFGGDMIEYVDFENATWNVLPWKFEAGTPNVAGGLGLAAAVDYLTNIGMKKVRQIEHYLTAHALKRLQELDFITVYGPDIDNRGGVISFNLTGGKNGIFVHPHDVAAVMDDMGIAIRAGHHCAQPLVTKIMKLPATSRMSFYIYNTIEEIDYTIDSLIEVNKVFN